MIFGISLRATVSALCNNSIPKNYLKYYKSLYPSKSDYSTTNLVHSINLNKPTNKFIKRMATNTSNEPPPAPEENLTEIFEKELISETELPHGSMKEVEVKDGHKVLLVNQSGTVSALANKCTHYGAPLIKGDFCNGVIRCPWHGACFNAVTGDIEEYPGLDSLQKHETIVKNGTISIKTSLGALKQGKRVKVHQKPVESNTITFLLVGGGPASVTCAEILRQNGFTGKIIIVTREKFFPYDRPKCSKAMTSHPDKIALRRQEFYKENGIEVQTNKTVIGISPEKKEVYFEDGKKQRYDKIMLATGAVCRVLPIPGNDLPELYTLRSIDDANKIVSVSEGKVVAVIGGSFIGMEVASCLVKIAASITVIEYFPFPFPVFGDKIGEALKNLFIEKKVQFELGAKVSEYVSSEGKLQGIKLADGKVIPCDVCIVAVGVRPATDFVKESSILLHLDGSLITNPYLEVQPDVYAAGDIATFPNPFNPSDLARIEHWQIAHNHGRVVALNMLKQKVAVNTVPFFWTVLFGKSVRFCGYSRGYDRFEFEGSLASYKFVGYYIKEGNVVAVISLDSDPAVAYHANIMKTGKLLSYEELKKTANLRDQDGATP